MRKLFHSLVVGLVVGTLVNAPLAAASPVVPPIGVILQAEKAQLSNSGATAGASIFDGDRISTSASGSARATFGTASQAYLPAQSSADFHRSSDGFNADLNTGSIMLSSAQGENFVLHANGAEIRPGAGKATIAEVTRVSANELVLTTHKGLLEVVAENETRSIPEGSAYRMIVQPADPASPQVAPGGRSRNKVIWIVVAAAAAGTAIIVWRATISPDKP